MKAGKKGKFQGNSKMVPGAPVGFRVGSLDMGGRDPGGIDLLTQYMIGNSVVSQ